METSIADKVPFIVIDGLDGCGKGTQINLLKERLKREWIKCVFTREPGGAPLSEALRELFKSELGVKASALTQFLMMWASRRNYLEEVVWPALEQGVPVFSDRGDSSTLAYQIYGKGAPKLEAEFWHHRELVFKGLAPTCYIFLDVPPEIARVRAHERGEVSHFDAEMIEFYERVDKGFRVFAGHPKVKMISVDGTRSREEIHKDIYRIVLEELGLEVQ